MCLADGGILRFLRQCSGVAAPHDVTDVVVYEFARVATTVTV